MQVEYVSCPSSMLDEYQSGPSELLGALFAMPNEKSPARAKWYVSNMLWYRAQAGKWAHQLHSLRIHINEEIMHVNGQQIIHLSFSYNHHIIWNSILYFCLWLYQQDQHNIYHPNKGKPNLTWRSYVIMCCIPLYKCTKFNKMGGPSSLTTLFIT